MVEPAEGARPSSVSAQPVEVAPRLEQPQHPVEPAGQRLGPRLHRPLQLADLALGPLEPGRAARWAAAVGAGVRPGGPRPPPGGSPPLGSSPRRRLGPCRRGLPAPPRPGRDRAVGTSSGAACTARAARRWRSATGGSSKSSASRVTTLWRVVTARTRDARGAARRPCGAPPTPPRTRPVGAGRSMTSPGRRPASASATSGASAGSGAGPLLLGRGRSAYSSTSPRSHDARRRGLGHGVLPLLAAGVSMRDDGAGRPGTGRSDRLRRWWASAAS